jgi:cephalosporin hydroxylase
VIEIGTMHGGSALWFADMLSAHRIEDPRVVSVDIEPLAEFEDERVSFLRGDAKKLGDALPPDLLASCARPWLVVDDGSHLFDDVTATLEFFHPHLRSGDYLVVEDGVLVQFSDRYYKKYENGPNRAVANFLERFGHLYEIDEALCDHYGRNVTWSLDGWLRRL